MSMRNETENLLWDSIDALIKELDEVITYGARIVPVYDMKQYIDALLATSYRHAKEVPLDVEM